MSDEQQENLRRELIQVAAVAVAWIENIDYGRTHEQDRYDVSGPLLDVAEERSRQELKWGSRNMGPEHWLPILLEEVGEVGTAVLDILDWSEVGV